MYKVVKGIFEGTEFKGEVINNRVYNLETKGQSYLLENCNIMEALKVGDKVEVIKPFPYADWTGKIGTITETSSTSRPVFYIEVEGVKTVCLPEYVKLIK